MKSPELLEFEEVVKVHLLKQHHLEDTQLKEIMKDLTDISEQDSPVLYKLLVEHHRDAFMFV